MPKILHFSDLHLDRKFAGMSKDLGRARRLALRESLTKICQLGRDLSVDAITCGGDLFERETLSSSTNNFLLNICREYSEIKFIFAPGNHDWYGGTESVYENNQWPQNVYVFSENYLTPYHEIAGVTLWGAAHKGAVNAPNFLENFQVEGSGPHIALFHGTAESGGIEKEDNKKPYAPFKIRQIKGSGLSHALIGHFHNKCDHPDYTYPGNPEPLEFGESPGRGAVLVQIGPTGVEFRAWHNVSVTKVHTKNVDLNETDNFKEIENKIKAQIANEDGYLRITLKGSINKDIDIFRVKKLEEAIGVSNLKYLKIKSNDLRIQLSYPSLDSNNSIRKFFIDEVLASDSIDEGTRKKIIDMGLWALDHSDTKEEYRIPDED